MFEDGDGERIDCRKESEENFVKQTALGSRPTDRYDWPWLLTPTCFALLDRTHTFAYVMNNAEATGEHLLTMLALDDSGRGELAKRGYNSGAAFSALSLTHLEGSTD